MQGRTVKEIAKRLKRSERSVHDWMSGKRKVPWWAPEILRLQHMEWYDRMQQMGVKVPKRKFGIVAGDVIEFPPARSVTTPEPVTVPAPAIHSDTKTATS